MYRALSHDSYFRNLHDEIKQITKIDTELRPAIGPAEVRSGSGASPLSKEEILRTSNEELAKYLSKFRTKDSWSGPTVGGLAELLAEVAKEMPEKFTEDLMSFINTGYIYIYEILKGLRDAWNGKKIIEWDKIFDFIKQYINRKDFWDDKYIVEEDDWLGGATHQWIAGIFSEILQDGTRDDNWAFPEQHFEAAEEIVFLLLDKLSAEQDEDIADYITYSLNTAFGKALTALILLALRKARVTDNKSVADDTKWPSKFRDKYDEILKAKIIEGFTNLGRYMPNLFYLDNKWVRNKIKTLENEKGSTSWKAFMDGYLSIGRVYDNLYELMTSHYEYGLAHDFKEKRNSDHLIQHICIGYLRALEGLDDPDGLFRKIIDEWIPDQIREVIGFFWMQRDYLKEMTEENEKMKEMIIDFWKLVYGKYKDATALTRADRQILSSASKLSTFLPQIDAESNNWLLLSAPYVHENFNSPIFIEYLDELKDKGDRNETAKYIAEIYLKMLEKFTPDFDQKHIRSIVTFLYDADATDSAKKICNTYGEFLRDIYEQHSRLRDE